VVRYDRIIPPGGKGSITLEVNSRTVRGKFEKKAMIWSDDASQMSIAVYVRGEVQPNVELTPGGYLSLWGTIGKTIKAHVDITNNHKEPMRITRVWHDMASHVKWKLTPIHPGYAYRLTVTDQSRSPAEYIGHLWLETDLPQEPELTIIVSGTVHAEAGK
jgi:hypothetical protein